MTYDDEKIKTIRNGTRSAVVTLRLYENGWVVHSIAEAGLPTKRDHDNVFSTLEIALKAAEGIWLS